MRGGRGCGGHSSSLVMWQLRWSLVELGGRSSSWVTWHPHPMLLWFSVSRGGLGDLPGSFVIIDDGWVLVVVDDGGGWKESR